MRLLKGLLYNYNKPENYSSSHILLEIQSLGDWILSSIRRHRLSLSIGPNWVISTWRRRHNADSEALYFKHKRGRWTMSRIAVIILICRLHRVYYLFLPIKYNCTITLYAKCKLKSGFSVKKYFIMSRIVQHYLELVWYRPANQLTSNSPRLLYGCERSDMQQRLTTVALVTVV
jgi:hypothetical protein